ncbi:putative NusB antitermination factor [Helianthus annuus]|nr:putative NusB antitermination factor [Helianthus annuus]KAJ0442398.1 putative NusB antitermination factor [Helianthus annuus]KAJ0442447.1 putative NusB antitermination factor [Helianthus annuus]KAJ0460159.1 putative NusB antitermination factor [Helianthus annuus]KAJ0640599.1 putative NusB antitermination factor [Helianthus annuus]
MVNHMSFGGLPVKTETAEEADELMRVDEKASEVEVEVLSAPPKLVYCKLILRFTRKLLVAVADKWDSHVLVMDKVAPQNWKKKEGVKSVDLDDLCRELQTALGTTKWQTRKSVFVRERERATGRRVLGEGRGGKGN